MRVILDSSVLISAFLTPQGTVGRLLKAGIGGAFEICLSPQIPGEVRERLLAPGRLRDLYTITDPDVGHFCDGLLEAASLIFDLPAIPRVCRDPDDDHVLAAAVAAHAEYLVTGDADLLDLGSYQGIQIVAVRAFLQEL